MNQGQITDYLNEALDEGFDVQAILNQVMTIRRGEAEIAARNQAWQTNSDYIFAVKSPEECLDPDYWDGFCILIVKESYWKEKQCLDDRHISHSIYLPSGFCEAGESTFEYGGPEETKQGIIRELAAAGFRHNLQFEAWCLKHDP